jgi:hypothetical protein
MEAQFDFGFKQGGFKMKRLIIAAIVIAVGAFSATSYAMGDRSKNLGIGGSNDNQHKHHDYTVPVDPNRPVHPVPEPSSIILLGAGLVGLAAWGRKK